MPQVLRNQKNARNIDFRTMVMLQSVKNAIHRLPCNHVCTSPHSKATKLMSLTISKSIYTNTEIYPVTLRISGIIRLNSEKPAKRSLDLSFIDQFAYSHFDQRPSYSGLNFRFCLLITYYQERAAFFKLQNMPTQIRPNWH